MGVDIVLWRVRIGTFIQPVKCRSRIPVLTVSGMSLYIRALLFLLLAVYGVETNRGPGLGLRAEVAVVAAVTAPGGEGAEINMR